MSDPDASAIMRKLEDIQRRLDSIDVEHAADMESLRANMRVLTEAHRSCKANCHVGNEDQIRTAIIAQLKITSSDRPAIKDDKS